MSKTNMPKGTEDVGDGVYVEKGGYGSGNPKAVIAEEPRVTDVVLPTVSGRRDLQTQDGDSAELDVNTHVGGDVAEGEAGQVGGVYVERGGSELVEVGGEPVVIVPTSDANGDLQDGEEVPIHADTVEGAEACDAEFQDAPVMHKTPKYRKRRYNQKESS